MKSHRLFSTLILILLSITTLNLFIKNVSSSSLNTEETPKQHVVPDFELTNLLDNTTFSLYEFLDAGTVVLVHFFGTTCPSCQALIPIVWDLYHRSTGKFMIFSVNVHTEDPDSAIVEFAIDNGMDWKVTTDTIGLFNNETIWGDYTAAGTPYCILVSPSYEVIWDYYGNDWEPIDVIPEITSVLPTDTSPPVISTFIHKPILIEDNTTKITVFIVIDEPYGIYGCAVTLTNLEKEISIGPIVLNVMANRTWFVTKNDLNSTLMLSNNDTLEFCFLIYDFHFNNAQITIQRTVGELPSVIEDFNAPVISDIVIDPTSPTQSTKKISVTCNATDETGIFSLVLEALNETFCFSTVPMIQGDGNLWNGTLNCENLICDTQYLYLKIIAEDTLGNSANYTITTLNVTSTEPESTTTTSSSESDNEKGSSIPSFTLILVYSAILVMVFIHKNKK